MLQSLITVKHFLTLSIDPLCIIVHETVLSIRSFSGPRWQSSEKFIEEYLGAASGRTGIGLGFTDPEGVQNRIAESAFPIVGDALATV
jgi:hypothetical protein